jgi:enediyne biosynthesis protein E4
MKKLLQIMLLTAVMAGSASAQQLVDLFHYQAEQNYTLLGLPAGAMAITRFEVQEAARVHEINVWFVNQEATGDSVVVYLFGKEGGGAYPLLLNPAATIRAFIPGQFNNLVRFNFDTQLPTFSYPSNFFVGVQILGTNTRVRMDNITQTPTCVTARGDTMYTSSYWQNLPAGFLPFNSRLNTGFATNNWYIGVKVEFTPVSQTGFTNMTLMAGLNVPPSGMRVAWADFDGDGYQDLLYGKHLFRNLGNGRFEDVSAQVGYDGGSTINMFIDVDNDGDLDIVCAPDPIIYINNGGVFTKDTEPGFSPSRNSTAMAATDYDGDGYVDIVVANGEYMYVKNPTNPQDSALVRGAAWEMFFYGNSQNGKFRDIKGMVLGGYRSGPYGRDPYDQQRQIQGYRPITGLSWVDIDLDGDMDLYASVDGLQPNYLWENQGNGFFREVAMLRGLQGVMKTDPNYVGLFGNTRGCDFIDYDNDGDPDLFVGEAAEQWRLLAGDLTSVWTNGGRPNYQYSQVPNTTSRIPFQLYYGDVAWGDFDNDGLPDVFVTSGENCHNGALLQQQQGHSFANLTYPMGIDAVNSLGVVWVDYDNDGDLDLCVATETGLKLYRNDLPRQFNWIAFNLRTRSSNVYAVGSRIEVTAGGKKFTRWVTVGKGAGSQSPYVQHFGIGAAAAVDSVLFFLPNGERFVIHDPEINKLHNVMEPEPVKVENTAAPGAITLHQNYPNPFARSAAATTRIEYDLTRAGNVTLHVYDARGAVVRTLVNGYAPAGTHVVNWDGSSDNGIAVSSGAYTCVLVVDGIRATRRMVVTK